MIEQIAEYVSEKGAEIAAQEISKYIMDNLDANITDEMRELTSERAIAQISFHLESFHVDEGLSDSDLKDAFDQWFSENYEEDLRKNCRRTIADETAKLKVENGPALSFLDQYRKEHTVNWAQERFRKRQ